MRTVLALALLSLPLYAHSADNADEQIFPAPTPVTAPADQTPSVEAVLESRKELEEAVIRAYNDPRVERTIKEAKEKKKSVTTEVAAPVPNATAPVATPSPTPGAVARASVPAPKSVPFDYVAMPDKLRVWGALLDAGIPHGVGVSAVHRPWQWLRVHGGLTHNTLAPGVRLGATVTLPFNFPVLPSASVEIGHAFEGDATKLVHFLTGDDSIDNPALRKISYDYATGQLGLEIGIPNKFMIYIHGGYTYVRATAGDLGTAVNEKVNERKTWPDSTPVRISVKDPTARIIAPAGKIGVVVYW